MKTAICSACTESEVLCKPCNTRLESKEIEQIDVDLARAMTTLADKHPGLERAEVLRSKQFDNLLLITVPKGTAGHFIGRKGIFIKDISEHIKLRIKVAEESSDPKELVQKVLYPANLKGVNVGADGKSYKVRVSAFDKRRLAETESFEKLLSHLLDGPTTISFE